MKTSKSAFTILLVSFLFLSFNGSAQSNPKSAPIPKDTYKVTFYELGSVRCIPCEKMEPVLESIREKYKGQVNVIFYDIWTSEGKEAAKNFIFESIPTQIFLDKDGKEFYRHEGFFPEDELIKILKMKGVK